MTTTRDAIELARETLSETLWDRLCCDPDDEPIGREAILARALLAEHERAERLEAGLREALVKWARDSGCGHTDDLDFEMGSEYTELRKLLQEKP